MKPKRIQLKRTKGFNLQLASWALNKRLAVNCARPGRWGNQFRVGSGGFTCAAQVVQRYREFIDSNIWTRPNKETIKIELKGKNLACWCKLGTPCHTDVLLEIANTQ